MAALSSSGAGSDTSGGMQLPANSSGLDLSGINLPGVNTNAPPQQTSADLTGNVAQTPAPVGGSDNIFLNAAGSTANSTSTSVAPQATYTAAPAQTATTAAQTKFANVNNQISTYKAQNAPTGNTEDTGQNAPVPPTSTPPSGGSIPLTGNTQGTTATGTGANGNLPPVPTPPDLTKTTISPEDQQQISGLQSMMATMDQASQNMITAITGEYDTRIAAQQLRNNLILAGTTTQNIAMGLSRYAPTVANSIFTAQEAANNRALADLESQKYQSLVQAQQAQAQMDFTALDKIHNDYVDAENRQRDLLQKQYDNAINYNKTVSEQRTAELDFQTKTAQNFAPSILQQLSTMTDPAQKTAFLDQFASAHNIDPATLSGVVQQYQDTQDQSMRTAMYSMLADNPRAGISMNDINSYDISGIAAKVANGPDFQLKTATERAQLANDLATAALAQAQVKMINDPNSITSLAQSYLDTGTMPTLPNPLMSATILDAARQLAPSYLPKGAIVAPDGLPKDIGDSNKASVQAGLQMYSALGDMQKLIDKVQTFPGGEQAYAAGRLVGLTPTEITQFQNDANMLAQNYDVLKGGVRGGSSSSLLQTAAQYVPKLGQLPKYNQAALDTFNKAVVSGIRDILATNSASLNNFPIMTNDEKTTMIQQITAQGKQAGYTQDQINQALTQYGLQ